jgi:HEAT repeat protein
MIRELVLAMVVLAFAATILVVVIVTRRLVVARRKQRAIEERLTPAALALTFESSSELAVLSKRDAVVFATLLGRFSSRLRGGSRERIARHFETQGNVRDAIDALSNRRSWRRAAAADLLGDMGSPEAVPALLAALNDGARDVRSAAARSLGRLGATEAVGPLVGALSSGLIPRGIVGHSVLMLGPGAVPGLVTLLAHDNPDVRATAAELIGLLGGAGEEEHLLGRLGDTSAAVRGQAAMALGRLGGAEAYGGLDGTLADGTPHVRAAAAEALGLIGDQRAFPVLLAVARDDAFEPARAAAHALGRLAPELLQEAAQEPGAGPFVREAAQMAELEGRAL